MKLAVKAFNADIQISHFAIDRCCCSELLFMKCSNFCDHVVTELRLDGGVFRISFAESSNPYRQDKFLMCLAQVWLVVGTFSNRYFVIEKIFVCGFYPDIIEEGEHISM